jgi:antitoxin HicB
MLYKAESEHVFLRQPREKKGRDMKFRITVEQDEDGAYVVQCPALPGCISQGRNREEALTNIKDAIQGYLASLKKHNEPIPPSIEEEMVEVSA